MARNKNPKQKLEQLKRNQNRYLSKSGGPWEIREGDEVYNNLSRLIIHAFTNAHPQAFLGEINLYGTQRQDVVSGKEPALKEYHGEPVFNFGCDFIVPVQDQTLEDLLRQHNASFTTPQNDPLDVVDAIISRIHAIGGELLLWF